MLKNRNQIHKNCVLNCLALHKDNNDCIKTDLINILYTINVILNSTYIYKLVEKLNKNINDDYDSLFNNMLEHEELHSTCSYISKLNINYIY